MVNVSMITPRPILEPQAIGSSKIPRVHFRHTPIELNEEMEDIKEVGEMSTQP
jgi:hypothetical protein